MSRTGSTAASEGRRPAGAAAVAIGVISALLAAGLAGLEMRYVGAALAAAAGLTGAIVMAPSGLLARALILALAFGLTVTLNVSFAQHYNAVGHYVFNVGGAAGLTITFVLLTALLLLAAFAAEARLGRRDYVLAIHKPLVVAQLLYMAAGIFSLVNAGDPLLVWLEELRLAHLLLVFVVVGSFLPRDLAYLVAGLSLGAMLQAGFAGLQVVSGSNLGLSAFGDVGAFQEAIDFGQQSRATGFKGNPNILAYYFEIIYPLCLAVALSRAGLILRLLAAMGAVATLGGLVLTLSRGGILTVIPSTLLVVAIVYRDRLLTRRTLVAAVALLGASCVAAIWVAPIVIERFTADDAGSLDHRAPLNAAALSMIKQFLIVGVGLNNFSNMFSIYDTTGYSRLFGNVNHVVHNLYLYVLGEVGIVGFTVFMGLFLTAFVSAARSIRHYPTGHPLAAAATGAACGLLAQLLHGLIDPGYKLSLGLSELISVSLGIVAAVATARRHQDTRTGDGSDAYREGPADRPD